MIKSIVKWSFNKAYAFDIRRLDASYASDGIREDLEISYVQDGLSEHTLDVYYPDDDSLKPVFIDIHGGGFISYDKEYNHVFANSVAQRGFVVFEINYRLAYPENTVFDQIEDIDKAVRWIYEHARSYGGDTDRMYVSGHCTGGVLATAETLLTLSPIMLADYGFEPKPYQYRGLVLDCGYMHFYKKSLTYSFLRSMIFNKGYEEDRRYKYLNFDSNPDINKLPRTVLITNKSDPLKGMTYFFEKTLKQNDVMYKLFEDGSKGHTGVVIKPGDLVKKFLKYIDLSAS